MNVVYWPNWRDNPYVDDLVTALARAGVRSRPLSLASAALRSADLVHVHWPEMIAAGMLGVPAPLRPIARLARLAGVSSVLLLARARRIPLVVTLHNLRPHDDARPLHTRVLRRVAGAATTIVVLSDGGRERAVACHPGLAGKRFRVVPLMDNAERFAPAPLARARAELGVAPDARLVVFFGRVRPYKGVDALARAFLDLDDPSVHLAVLGAGELGDPALSDELRRHPRVTWSGRRVSDADIAAGLSAADLVVLPFRDIENSSSLITALAAGAPTAVPELPATAEVAAEYGTDRVLLYPGELDAATLQRLLERAARFAPAGRTRVELPHRRLDRVAERQRQVYAEALDVSGR